MSDGLERILIVDDDPLIARFIRAVLLCRGYEVYTATDGEEGLLRAKDVKPDAILLDVMMPKLDGWATIKLLRSQPELAFVPVLFLTALGAEEDRVRGFRLGADDYIQKPISAEELCLRVANALRHRAHLEQGVLEQARASQLLPASRLQGSLDQLGLASLLSVLELERKSGVARITHARTAEIAQLFLRDGQVVRARLYGKPMRRNEQAIYELLTWAEGSFEFVASDIDVPDEIQAPTIALMLEGARLQDEALQTAEGERLIDLALGFEHD
jgi:DNA-binding response OmpR family regulator